MAGIFICKRCKFGEKIFYNSRDIEFFLGDYFFLARPVYAGTTIVSASDTVLRLDPILGNRRLYEVGDGAIE